MMFENVTYAASPLDCAINPSSDYVQESVGLTENIAAFLIRVAAYFQGCLASLPRAMRQAHVPLKHMREPSLTLIDAGLESGSEPLQRVRMNRHLSRRLRWLMRRGRVQRSGQMRLASPADEARCRMTPGQFMEYCIRLYGWSRVQAYRLGLSRRLWHLMAGADGLEGDALCLRKARVCAAPLHI